MPLRYLFPRMRNPGQELNLQDRVWRVPATSQLSTRTFGEQHVVFHSASGDTHLLDQISFTGLLCLQEEPLGREQLALRLSHRLGLPCDEELRQYARKLLVRFDRLGLVEPVEE